MWVKLNKKKDKIAFLDSSHKKKRAMMVFSFCPLFCGQFQRLKFTFSGLILFSVKAELSYIQLKVLPWHNAFGLFDGLNLRFLNTLMHVGQQV